MKTKKKDKKVILKKDETKLKSTNKKKFPFYVLNVLIKYSDYHNPLTYNDIIKHIKEDYGVDIERKTIKSNIDLLNDFELTGYEIESKTNHGAGVALTYRRFSSSEASYLSALIMSQPSIPMGEKQSLIDAITADFSDNFKKHLPKNIKNGSKGDKMINHIFFENYSKIEDCIRRNHKFEFEYYNFDERGNKIINSDERGKNLTYKVTPLRFCSANGVCYLFCLNSKSNFKYPNTLSFYRIDLMANPQESSEKIDSLNSLEEYKNIDLDEYFVNRPYLFTGKPINIKIECLNKYSLKYISEWFQKYEIDNSRSKPIVTLKTDPKGFFIGLCNIMSILESWNLKA